MPRYLIIILLVLINFSFINGQSLEDVLRVANPDLAQGSEALKFKNKVIDLGKISEDTPVVEGHFTMTFGETDITDAIVIKKVVSTCGCLKTEFDKVLLLSGDSTIIKFRYYPKGYPGDMHRRVFLYTSLDESIPSAILDIKADVEPTKDRASNYRYSMGSLFLKQKMVTFSDGERRTTERINCYNNSQWSMKLSILGACPEGIEFRTEPKVIPPKGEGRLVFTHIPIVSNKKENVNPNTDIDVVKKKYELILDGVQGRPSQRIIEINLDY